MLSPLRKRRKETAPGPVAESRALMDRLEGRIYFAHLGHEVFLPAAAENGSEGIQTAIAAPGDHRRGKLIFDEV